ncbi:c-type cytochrome biogenesis protein CcmI [Alsobacter sp. R-9]
MLVTLALALMTGAAALAVLLPLSRRPGEGAAAVEDADTVFYKSQLADIDRDLARGLVEPSEAAHARVEAARRLLAAQRRAGTEAAVSGGTMRRRVAAAVVLVGLPLVSLSLYLRVGSPEMPAQPLASRQQMTPEEMDFAQALAKIEAHLAANPDDGRGWEVVSPFYMQMGRYGDAVRGYATAVRTLGETPQRLENLGEAQVAAADGIVTAEARTVIERALAKDGKLVKARFYRALAAEQDGRKDAAVTFYTDLAQDLPAGNPLLERVNETIVRLGGTAVAKGVPQGGEAIAALPDAQRQDAIRGMVEALDARLGTDGTDVEAWLRLVRSRMVLNEPDKARAAYARGLAALAGDPAARTRLEQLGRDLGLGGS